ncbi:1-phosphatidylinositol 4,5-bisphosphate phosphodiesterase epsilon-1-like [Hetaerina americana]|uniref:1-phosphatidylinositol 4,5-bisphosphate phosphodiesterase epsilon-1-like n=1 Tax=Hetaerina americana TaxID=62018 RepID=UPI003A7F2DEC
MLHFPEEVALRLAEEERRLFREAPPEDYLRHVTLDAGPSDRPPAGASRTKASPPPEDEEEGPSEPAPPPELSVHALVRRFTEVSSWVTHLIITQPTHEDRKAVLSCILRLAISSWNIGNFNGAMEILAGLKSGKLKPFWLSISEREGSLPTLEFLSASLLNPDQYEAALKRALAIPSCKPIPFFGAFLRELTDLITAEPSLIVLAPKSAVTTPAPPEQGMEAEAEDHFATDICPGGLINVEKMRKAQTVLDRIGSIHQMYEEPQEDPAATLQRDGISIHTSSIERSYLVAEEEEEGDGGEKAPAPVFATTIIRLPGEEEVAVHSASTNWREEPDDYRPVQPLANDHGVSFFPICGPKSGIDHHVLQVLHHGTTAVHWEPEGGRTALVYIRLERSCATLTWSRPTWSGLRGGGGGGSSSSSSSSPDYTLKADPEEAVSPGLLLRLSADGAPTSPPPSLDEGFLDLPAVKEVVLGGGRERGAEAAAAARRFGLERRPGEETALAIVYGANLSDNRALFFLCPPTLCGMWYSGLSRVVRGLKRQLQLSDRRMLWLKEQYLQLYFEDNCCGPNTAEAIRIFGGRDWTLASNVGGSSPPDNGTLRRGTSVKFKKKKSIGNIQTLKELSVKQHEAFSTLAMVGGGMGGDPSPRRPTITGITTGTKIPYPPRSRSASSDIIIGVSPRGSADDLDRLSSSPVHHLLQHHNLLLATSPSSTTPIMASILHRERSRTGMTSIPSPGILGEPQQARHLRAGSITQETQLDFADFVALFRSFSLRARKDLRDLFDQLAITCRSMSDSSLNDGPSSQKSSPEHGITGRNSITQHMTVPPQRIGLLTRNSSLDLATEDNFKGGPGLAALKKKKIFDAIAAASIVSNCAGIDTSRSQVITTATFWKFLETRQLEHHTEDEVKALIQRHEPDAWLRSQGCLSFEGFARFLMDKDNYAFPCERMAPDDDEMDQPMSHYYIASSHNTYLTGHQLKGESSVELYSQVLLTGCRCVELDCWDGDDGTPLIYHGHTFTTKIPFRSVVEAINRSAFVTSPYPVILSIENHCSIQQQARMAHIFQSVFGEKLVSNFLFEADLSDEPRLPSPYQLKGRILVKNKRLTADVPPPHLPLPPLPSMSATLSSAPLRAAATIPQAGRGHGQPAASSTTSSTQTGTGAGRASSIISNASGGSVNDDFSDDEDDDDDDDDENLGEDKMVGLMSEGKGSGGASGSASSGVQSTVPRTDSSSSHESGAKHSKSSHASSKQQTSHHSEPHAATPAHAGTTAPPPAASTTATRMGRDIEWSCEDDSPTPLKPKKQSSQIARELSDMVIYVQAIKFRGLNTISPSSSVRSRRPPQAMGSVAGAPASAIVAPSAPGTPTTTGGGAASGHLPGVASLALSTTTGTSPVTMPTPGTNLTVSGSQAPCVPPDIAGKRPNVNHPCYQCSSLNENTAKKLCRKQPLALLAHTETQLVRTYPAGMRIDSSNFNPTIFWAFGIQMVALNYQTEDPALHLNAAMFEQNGRCGYVRKPSVMWDRGHMMYRRFNPWDKEFDGLHAATLSLTILSGQFVCPGNLSASVCVEVELVGLPADCNKQRTRVVPRNALNPIWGGDPLLFRVSFRHLAFLRLSVLDAGTGHIHAQRVLPLNCLRPGYRHVRLRSPLNAPLHLSTLFVYSRIEEESLDFSASGPGVDTTFTQGTEATITADKGLKENGDAKRPHIPMMDASESGTELSLSAPVGPIPSTPLPAPTIKRRMFFLMVYGVVAEEPYTILKITQESTTREVVASALAKAGIGSERIRDFLLVEEVARGWEARDRGLPPAQRVLDPAERPLEAQAAWTGEGRFLLKRVGDDPSSRAWLSSIRSSGAGRRRGGASTVDRLHRRTNNADGVEEVEDGDGCDGGGMHSWEEHDNFLVCVYNVSPEIPYAILKVPLGASAQDVLAQALVKARRMEDPARFVLVEELEWGGSSGTGGAESTSGALSGTSSGRRRTRQQRILDDDENVYATQANWRTLGRFVLRERMEATLASNTSSVSPAGGSAWGVGRTRGTNLRTATLERLSKGLRAASARSSGGGKTPVQEALSDPTASHRVVVTAATGPSDGGSQVVGAVSDGSHRPRHREVHSEGETLSDDEREYDFRSAVSRLKKVSLKKLRVWK